MKKYWRYLNSLFQVACQLFFVLLFGYVIIFIPLRPKNLKIVPWCNGSTTDFGSVCIGSNPVGTTTSKYLFRIQNTTKIQLFRVN